MSSKYKDILISSFGDSASELLDKYPDLMSELTDNIVAVTELKLKASTQEEIDQANLALEALQQGAVASIKAMVAEDSLKAISSAAIKFALQIVKATLLA